MRNNRKREQRIMSMIEDLEPEYVPQPGPPCYLFVDATGKRLTIKVNGSFVNFLATDVDEFTADAKGAHVVVRRPSDSFLSSSGYRQTGYRFTMSEEEANELGRQLWETINRA